MFRPAMKDATCMGVYKLWTVRLQVLQLRAKWFMVDFVRLAFESRWQRFMFYCRIKQAHCCAVAVRSVHNISVISCTRGPFSRAEIK